MYLTESKNESIPLPINSLTSSLSLPLIHSTLAHCTLLSFKQTRHVYLFTLFHLHGRRQASPTDILMDISSTSLKSNPGTTLWSSVKTPHFWCRGWVLIPGWGTNVPHAVGQINLHSTAREFIALQWRPSAAKIKINKVIQRSSH